VGWDATDWQTYRNDAYGFELKYPPGFKIDARSSVDSRYEEDFQFTNAATTPLTLQVTNLDRYLPQTNTPTIQAYIQSLRRMEHFKEANIGDKGAYEFLNCGRAACNQEVVFIKNSRKYEFSIGYSAFFPNGQINGDVDPRSISFETAPAYIQRIIESLAFLPVKVATPSK
jgi:hypothetical protein